MLHKSLYTEEETTDCCSTLYCKCLNTKIDFINESLNSDQIDYEYDVLQTCLDDVSAAGGDINSTLFCRSFLLSVSIKFKWLIAVEDNHLYKCNCCSCYLFITTDTILGKCLINFELLQNYNKDIIMNKPHYSSLFSILLQPNDSKPRINNEHPLNFLVDALRKTEENKMKQRIDEFRQNEQRKLYLFCQQLDREYEILSSYASHQQNCFAECPQLKTDSLLKIEKDFNHLMEENLKLDNEDVYNYLNKIEIEENKIDEIDINEIKIQIPLNEMGEVLFNKQVAKLHMLDDTETDPQSQQSQESLSDTIQDVIGLDIRSTGDLYDDNDDDDDDDLLNVGFAAISEEDDEEEEEEEEELMFELDSESNPLKMIPEFELNNGIIQEDSETDDRLLLVSDSPTFTRSRGKVVAARSINMLSPLTSTTFKMKSSKSLKIKPTFHSKSLLSKTLNKNSALVNLKDKTQFETDNYNSQNVIMDNYNSQTHPKTFNPPKQWLDVLKMEEDHLMSHKKKRSKSIIKPNGELLVNNHTFKGIWAHTLPQNKAPIFPQFTDKNIEILDQDKTDQDDGSLIHSLFDTKQNQHTTNVYAFSMSTKYSRKQTQ